MTTSATARCWAAYAPPSPKPRSAGPDFAASVDGIEWVANSTSTSVARSSPGTAALELGEPVAHALDERLHEAGVVEELAHLVDLDASPSPRPVSASASAKSSRYWRQLEYEVYALVAIAMSFVWPAAVRLVERVGEVRVPVAVAPQHGQVDAARGELGLEGGLELRGSAR